MHRAAAMAKHHMAGLQAGSLQLIESDGSGILNMNAPFYPQRPHQSG